MVKIASLSLDDSTLWVTRHYTGSGSMVKMVEVYLIKGQKFLGRFEIQEIPTFDAVWTVAKDHPSPPTEQDLAIFRKARMQLLSLTDKFWG